MSERELRTEEFYLGSEPDGYPLPNRESGEYGYMYKSHWAPAEIMTLALVLLNHRSGICDLGKCSFVELLMF